MAILTSIRLTVALPIVLMLTGVMYAPPVRPSSAAFERATSHTVVVGGNKVFYREAGRPSSPTLVLLHGNPSSSFMFRDLIPRLANYFHVIAPDYPGFGYSDSPNPESYAYTFDHLAQTIDQFLTQIGATEYLLYMCDYGGPVGMRVATAHPGRIKGLIIQNANAYKEGLSPESRAELEQRAQAALQHPQPARLSRYSSPSAFEANLKWTRQMYALGAHNFSGMAPDGYTLDAVLLSRPRQNDIQDILDDDDYTNMLLYPTWQQWLREHQPRTLIVWGRGDYILAPLAAEAYKRDLPRAKLVYYDGGHFLLEEYAPEVARAIIEMFAPRN